MFRNDKTSVSGSIGNLMGDELEKIRMMLDGKKREVEQRRSQRDSLKSENITLQRSVFTSLREMKPSNREVMTGGYRYDFCGLQIE